MKKKHALLQVDYDTLTQKLNSYASSSYIIEHMVGKRKGNKNVGVGYNACLVRDLSDCNEANRVLKENEKTQKTNFDKLKREVHDLEVTILNNQDSITYYLNVIDELKKKHALLEVDYDTLNQKLKSYASSSYIIEHMVSKREESKHAGIGYHACPPPLNNVFSSPINDDPITGFQVKAPLTVEPTEIKVSKKKNSEGCTKRVLKFDGEVEDLDGDYDELLKTGLGSKNATSPCVASSSKFQKKTTFKPKPAQTRQNHPVPPPLRKRL